MSTNVGGTTRRLGIRRYTGLLLALPVCVLQLVVTQGQSRPLGVGESLEDSLPLHGSKSYSLALSSGRFVYGEVNQITVDVVVRVFDPSGRKVLEVDSPVRGPEPFQFTTETAGTFRIEVTPFEENAGNFAIRVIADEPKATTPEGTVDQLMVRSRQPGAPGGAVAVVRDGKLIFAKGYGLADVEHDAPNTPSTPFHLASVSKQFTAFAIVLLAQQGKLSIDDDVRKHIPELHDFGATITLRHLLTHTSGLRDQWDLWSMSGHRMDDVIRQQDLMTLMVNQRELNFTPGEEHLYCNSGYTLLSEVVARVSGMPFGEFLEKQVFDPLGMTSTQVYDDHERLVHGRAYSYTTGSGGFKKAVLSYANSGATSLFSTAEDLAKWLRNWKTGEVGGPDALRTMQQAGQLNNGKTLDYALGVTVGPWRGLQRVAHGGGDAGYRTFLAYFPEIDAGVIALGNDGSFNAGGIAADAAGVFFADKLQPAPAPQQQAEEQKGEPWKPTPGQLAAFAGRYYSPELETFYTVRIKDSQLVASHRRLGDIVLKPGAKENRFDGSEFALRTVDFVKPAHGQALEMRVSTFRVRNLVFERVGTEPARP